VKRTDLFALAYRKGHMRGKRVSRSVKKAIEKELRTYFSTPEGQAALADAPRVMREDGGIEPMSIEDAVQALLEEIEADDRLKD